MKTPSCLLSLVFLLLAGLAISAGEIRTWTSVDGRTVEAELVRVDGDKVEIKTEKGLFRLELSKLSPEDQEFVRQQSAASELKRPTKMRIEDREWTLREGKVKARFVRAKDANIQLKRGNKLITHSILFLTPEDAAYIQDLLESRGELEKLKDDPTVAAILSLAESHKTMEKRKREREAAALAATQKPMVEAPVEIPPPVEPPYLPPAVVEMTPVEPMPPIVSAPANSEGAATTSPMAIAMPPTATMPPTVTMPPLAMPPVDSGLNSKDPWERDQTVMAASNKAAYYWLSGILGLLVVFGPIIYVFQRSR